MDQAEAKARLVALQKTLARALRDRRAKYFDPPVVLELFERWSPVREALRASFPLLLGDIPSRESPVPSRTTDFQGRGFIERKHVQQLYDDMQYVLDAIGASAAAVTHGDANAVLEAKKTGRTQWDLLHHLWENRRMFHWASALAWVLVVSFAAAVSFGVLSVRLAGDPVSGDRSPTSPFVHWIAMPREIAGSRCAEAARQALQTANPVKLEEEDIEDDMQTSVADFGLLTGWISCIGMHPTTRVYIGVAGDNFSDGKNKAAQLRDLFTSRVVQPSD
jgi:hypothetical protein